jgi:hypothetical protein
MYFDAVKNLRCKRCNKQSMSKNWVCPCGEKWFVCNKHKWSADDGLKLHIPIDNIERPTKCPKKDDIKNDTPSGRVENPKPSKAHKKQQHGDGVTFEGEGDPNLMVSHQELLEYELKMENEKHLHPGKNRPRDHITLQTPTSAVKRPRVLGPKMNAKFGVQTSEPAYTKDEMNKAKLLGETARKRGGDHLLAPAKKPKSNGEFSSNHGGLNHGASSSSSL